MEGAVMSAWKYTLYDEKGDIAAEQSYFETKTEAESFGGIHAAQLGMKRYSVKTEEVELILE